MATAEERAKLAEWFRARDIESVIYDPFGRAYTGKSQNDPGEVGSWLADLDRFTRGAAGIKDIFLPAHAGWDGERTRGASALEDWADSIITLTRDSDENGGGARFVRAIGRDVNLEEDQLRYHDDERYLELARTGSRTGACGVATTAASDQDGRNPRRHDPAVAALFARINYGARRVGDAGAPPALGPV